jgi:hypothetical protein
MKKKSIYQKLINLLPPPLQAKTDILINYLLIL